MVVEEAKEKHVMCPCRGPALISTTCEQSKSSRAEEMEKLVGCISGRGPCNLHLDKCLVPSILTDRGGGKWNSGGGKSVDDEYSNLVGHCFLPFCSVNLHTAPNLWIFEWANTCMCVCVVHRKGQCSSLKHFSTFKGWILCPCMDDTSFKALQDDTEAHKETSLASLNAC